jgi:import inner membrane translocase subunit TIM54
MSSTSSFIRYRLQFRLTSKAIQNPSQTRASTTPDVSFIYSSRTATTNTDLVLLECPFDPKQQLKNSVLLTTDLTKAVADEAIARRDSIIVAYRELITI